MNGTPRIPKMSLEAQFDDLCRYSAVLQEGNEDEFIAFIKRVQGSFRKWNDVGNEIQKLKVSLSNCQAENKVLDTKLKHIRSLFETEMKKRIKAENEKSILERQIMLIREVLLADQNAMNDQTKEKLAFLSTTSLADKNHPDSPKRLETIDESVGSLLSSSDISFDKTDEDLDNGALRSRRSKGKRGSAHNGGSPVRKRKSQENGGETVTKRVDVLSENHGLMNCDHEDNGPALNTRSRRSNSEPAPKEMKPPTPPRTTCRSESDQLDDLHIERNRGIFGKQGTLDANINYRRFSGSTPLQRYSSTGKLRNRNHVFCVKTLIKPEKCHPCGRGIKFYKQALKCQDCRATCHPECKDKVPLPCVPTTHTPTGKGTVACLADYTPTAPPMIPALIVHCVNEIDFRGLSTLGLYRISGSEREVKELKERFLKGKGAPNLSKVDIHAICGTIKDFLRSLQEPLIPRALWRDFVQAAQISDEEERFSVACQAISQLPPPNRDTLAFLALHFQRVSDSRECQMPMENIAKVLGPTIVGYSTPDPPECNLFTETSCQFQVMSLLLKMTFDYWNNLLNTEQENVFPPISHTPEPRSTPDGSIQGSISSGGGGRESWTLRNRGVTLGRTTLTPRNSRSGFTKSTKKQFFQSPLRK